MCLCKSKAKSMPKDAISTAKHTSFIIPDKHGLKSLNCRVILIMHLSSTTHQSQHLLSLVAKEIEDNTSILISNLVFNLVPGQQNDKPN